MSGFEGSSQGQALILLSAPLSPNSKAESAARWVPSPRQAMQVSGEVNSCGPAIPTRLESAIDQPEDIKMEVPPKLRMANSSDDDSDCLQAEAGTSQQYPQPTKQEIKDGDSDGPERLTSIAELEWSDEEDNLTNQTPPALLESASLEQAPVMPVRFKSEVLDA